MSSDSFAKPQSPKNTKCSGQFGFAVRSFVGNISKGRGQVHDDVFWGERNAVD
jgi:hypothetical protein